MNVIERIYALGLDYPGSVYYKNGSIVVGDLYLLEDDKPSLGSLMGKVFVPVDESIHDHALTFLNNYKETFSKNAFNKNL